MWQMSNDKALRKSNSRKSVRKKKVAPIPKHAYVKNKKIVIPNNNNKMKR